MGPFSGRVGARMTMMRTLVAGAVLFGSQWGSAEGKKPLSTAHSSVVPVQSRALKAAGERTVTGEANVRRPAPRAAREALPALANGPRIPEHLRKALAPAIERRIDRDVASERVLRREATVLLETFVREEAKNARDMPEALMRLGELYWEDERERFVGMFAAWEKRPVDQRGGAPEPSFERARALFARVLADYPEFDSYDLALYVDGFLASEQGREDQALARFNRILREFPDSRFVPDAHMARAEAAFNHRYDYAGALGEYEQVLRYGQSDLYGLALFKSAWCAWRLGRTDEAAQRFLQTFRMADDRRTVSVQKRRQLDELQAEALKYLVQVFTEDEKNSAADVYAFLLKAGGAPFASRIVKALATSFYEQAQYERGIEAYELLLKLDPTAEEAPLHLLAIADGYAISEDWPHLRATYERLIRDYTAPKGVGNTSGWARAQSRPETVTGAIARVEEQLRRDATNLHGKAQRDKTSRAEFEGASALYEVYLAQFAQSPHGNECEFALAEVQFYHLGKNSDAATHYMAVARRNPHGPLTHDAVYNAIAALERARGGVLAENGTTRADSDVDKKFTEAMELYVQLYPDDPNVPEVLFRQGKLYYDRRVFDAAVRQWGLLLEKYPNSTFAAGAGELTLDSFNQARDYANIELWARRLKTAPSFRSKEAQQKLDTLIVQSVFKRGEQMATTGEHGNAAAAYLRAAREFPGDARAAQACINAEIEAQKARDVPTMKAATDLLISQHGGAKEAPSAVFAMATQLQSMGLFSEAAGYHEAVAERFAASEHGKDAAYNAVVLRSATADHDRAIVDGRRFRQLYPNAAEVDDVTRIMGKAHERQKRFREAAELYRSETRPLLSADRRADANVRLATVLIAQGAVAAADDALAEAHAIGQKRGALLSSEGKEAVAHARYMQGERVLAAFEQIQIAGDVKKLAARLKQKTELLRQAANIFLDCVGMGVAEWSTAALYQVGHTYEAFAASLRNAPPPANLSGPDQEAYQQQVESFVVPIEEKSLEAYENGWKRAVELGIFNAWTAKMREALGRLNGELYPPLKEIGFEVRAASPASLPPLLSGPRLAPAVAPRRVPGAGEAR